MAHMDYMDPNVICPQKADKLNLSLSLSPCASDAELRCFLWSVPWKGWVNDREAGDLNCNRAHYDDIVMEKMVNLTTFYISNYPEDVNPCLMFS